MTSDPRSGDAFPPAAGPGDATSAWSAPTPSATGPAPVVSPSAALDRDPFDRPAPLPVERAVVRSRGGGVFVNVLLGLALVVAVGGVAFAVGRATAPATAAAGTRTGLGNGQGGFFQGGGPNASGAPGGFGGFGGAGGISIQGTVTAVGADSITLQLASGQTITIPTDATTAYRQSQAATATAVTAGSTVIVQVQGGRGAFGNGNGNGGQGGGPNASGAPGRTLGPATTVTIVPSGS